MMQSLDIEFVRKEIEPIIKEAGKLVCSFFRSEDLIVTKKHDESIVTIADRVCEKYLIEKLAKIVPGVAFYAEESGIQGVADYCFVIDPIDGTTNFAAGMDYFCISVCLTYKNKPLLGVIYQPTDKDYYYAVEGQGAFLNNRRLMHKSKIACMRPVLIIHQDLFNNNCLNWYKIMQKRVSLRYFGSAALDLAHIADQRADGVLHKGLSWWDVAAGVLLVKESGGIVTTFKGELLTYKFKNILAGSKSMHKLLQEGSLLTQ